MRGILARKNKDNHLPHHHAKGHGKRDNAEIEKKGVMRHASQHHRQKA